MSNDLTLIISLLFILLLSPFVARIINLPTTPIEIVMGAVATYFGWMNDHHFFELIAEFGFLYLMFLAGSELNLKKIFHKSSGLIERSLLYLGILYLTSFLFTLYFGFSNIFIVLLPLISIGLVASLSKEYGSDQEWIQLSFNIGGIGEVVSIVIITIVSAFFQYGDHAQTYINIAEFILFMIFIVILFKFLKILFWWFPEIAEYIMPTQDNQEQDLRFAFAILFAFLSGMIYLHLEAAFGAFLAGVFLTTFFENKHQLHIKLSSIGFGFFIPLFFIHIGTTFEVDALFLDGLILKALLITFVMISMRLISAFVFYKKVGLKQTLLFGLSHSMPLTLLIAIATLAYQSNSIDQFHYYAFILSALFEVILVMMGIKWIYISKQLD